MLEKSSKMSTRDAIAVLAGPYSGNRDRWLANAAKSVTGVSFRTMRSLWHGEITNPDHLAAQAVIRQARILEARRDAQVVANFFHSHAQALADADPALHRNEIDAFLEAARLVGGRDRTRTESEVK